MTEKEWLQENIDKYKWKDLTTLFNQEFGTCFAISGIRNKCERTYKLFKSKEANSERLFTKFTAEVRKWIAENANRFCSYEELASELNKEFRGEGALLFTSDQVKHFCGDQCRRKGGDKRCHLNSFWYNPITEEQLNWIKENASSYTNRRLCREFNKRWNETKSEGAIKSYCKKLGVTVAKDPRLLTEEQLAFIKEIGFDETLSDIECAEMYNARFGTEIDTRRFADMRYEHFGLKGFKVYNHKGFKYKPIGTEVVDSKTGFTFVKVNENKWVDKKRILYEQYHPEEEKLTSNDVIEYLDGDKTNFSKENLVRVSRREHQLLIGYRWWGMKEIMEVGMEVLKVKEFIRKNRL